MANRFQNSLKLHRLEARVAAGFVAALVSATGLIFIPPRVRAVSSIIPRVSWSMVPNIAPLDASDPSGQLTYYSDVPVGAENSAGYVADSTSPLDRVQYPEDAVELNACDSGNVDGGATFSWTIDEQSYPPSWDCKTTSPPMPANTWHRLTLRIVDNGQSSVFGPVLFYPRDWLIVSIGDSVASGEGNPTDPFKGSPWAHGNATCHRSSWAGPARAAYALETADPQFWPGTPANVYRHADVTFIHLACSGASVIQGLIGSQNTNGQNVDPQLRAAQLLVGQRQIDALLLSIGANDVDFKDTVMGLLTHGYLSQSPIHSECPPTAHFCPPPESVAASYHLLLEGTSTHPSLATALQATAYCITGVGAPVGSLACPGAALDPGVTIYAGYHDPTRDLSRQYCTSYFGSPVPSVWSQWAEGFYWPDSGMYRQSWPGVIGAPAGSGDPSLGGIEGVQAALASKYAGSSWVYLGDIWKDFAGESASTSEGHGYCSSSNWVDTIPESLAVQGDPNGAFHPNHAGQADIGQHIHDALSQTLGDTPPPLPADSVLTISLDPSSITADGMSTSIATIRLTDPFGNGIPGQAITLATNGDTRVGQVVDNGDGSYTGTITASSTADTELLTATDTSAGLSATAVLSEIAPVASPTPTPSVPPGTTPLTAFSATTDSEYVAIGSDGNAWVAEQSTGVERITQSGTETLFITTPLPDQIIAGPDGNLWMTTADPSVIMRMTTSGSVTQIAIPLSGTSWGGIAAGGDGDIYVDDGPSICKINPADPTAPSCVQLSSQYNSPFDLTQGPDGAVWCTQPGSSGLTGICRIATDLTVTEYPVSGVNESITSGGDGALWVAGGPTGLLRVTTSGTVTDYAYGGAGIVCLAEASDGSVWFTTAADPAVVGHLAFPAGQPTLSSYTFTQQGFHGIAPSSNGTLWVTDPIDGLVGYFTP